MAQVSLTISKSLKERLETAARVQGKSLEQIVEDAARHFLDVECATPTSQPGRLPAPVSRKGQLPMVSSEQVARAIRDSEAIADAAALTPHSPRRVG